MSWLCMIMEVMKFCPTNKKSQAETIHNTFLKIHKILKSRVSDPNGYIMENGCSNDLQ